MQIGNVRVVLIPAGLELGDEAGHSGVGFNNGLIVGLKSWSCLHLFLSRKGVLVGAGTIDRGNRYVEFTQVHRQLSAVVIPVVQHD